LFLIEIIDLIIPPKTPPVTPKRVMIAQFIPMVAEASGSPKQVEHAIIESGSSKNMHRTEKR
tara:strand:+ start:32826 stop:33011 length:186 start_codon:yes stop_codon:yes gene_type:complete